MKRQKGFTLVEVVAAIVIITIILLSFYPMLFSAKKASTSNVDKIVMINLAEATLDRLKLDPYAYIELPSLQPAYLSSKQKKKVYTYAGCGTDDQCKNAHLISLNDQMYYIEVTATQDSSENDSKLINVTITIKDQTQKKNYSVEGYVSYE